MINKLGVQAVLSCAVNVKLTTDAGLKVEG